jgi:hypothetical protein
MIFQKDSLAADPLAQRLEHMRVATPQAPRLTAVASPITRRRLPAWRGALTAAAAIVIVALIATAFTYRGGLLALTQDALRAAGLTSSQVASLSGSAETANLKVSVSGGYADQVSTVLFVEIDLMCQQGPGCTVGAPYLTDQYGTRYGIIGGEGIGVGNYPIFFQPLSGQAKSGAHLTLHVPEANADVVVQIPGTFATKHARDLTPPTGIVDSEKNVTYQVISLVDTGPYLEVHIRLSGDLQNVIVPAGTSGEAWPGVYLVDPSGKWLIPLSSFANPLGVNSVNSQLQDETRIFSIARPGNYRIVVSNSAPGSNANVLAQWTIAIG